MARVFLSCVTDEFGSYRQVLFDDLTRPGVEIETQERFLAYGAETLLNLDECIASCQAVVHLAGDRTGSVASEANRKAILARHSYEKLAELGLDQATVDELTYTQWEAWLAVLHGKKLYLCTPLEDARRDQPPLFNEAGDQQRTSQQHHLNLLRKKARYAENPLRFIDANRLSVSILRALHEILPPVRMPISSIPASIRGLFKGRDEWLARLRQALLPTSHTSIDSQRVAVWGAGGFGKTRLAVEYAHLFAARYSALLMISANTADQLRNNIADLAACIDLPQAQSTDVMIRYNAVIRWLDDTVHRGWLLIIDNVDSDSSFGAVTDLAERLHFGQVIITGRQRDWPMSVTQLHIDKLDAEASAFFLLDFTDGRRVAESNDPDDDKRQARVLADALDGLALALVQAGGAIRKRALSFSEYLQDWDRNHSEILNDPDFDPRLTHYPRTLAATWKTSYERLPDDSRIVFDILCWLAPDPIPESLITQEWPEEAAALMPPDFNSLDIRQRARLFHSLYDYCLAEQPTDTTRCLMIHRVIQSVGRTFLQKRSAAVSFCRGAASLVEAHYVTERNLSLAESCLPALRRLAAHVRFLLQNETDDIPLDSRCRLQMMLSRQYDAEGLLTKAEQFAQESVNDGRTAVASAAGDLRPQIALCRALCNAIAVKNAIGMHAEALAHCQETQALTDSWISATDLGRLRCRTYVLIETSRTWHKTGDLDKASLTGQHCLQAAQQTCDHFPSDDLSQRELGIALNNLGSVRESQGKPDDASQLFDRSCKISETLCEREPQNLARQRDLGIALASLGSVRQSQGKLDDASQLFDRSCNISERLCEREPENLAHQRDLGLSLSRVGRVRHRQGKLDDASQLFDRSCKICETLCEREPENLAHQRDLGIALESLGLVRESQEKLDDAFQLFDRSCKIRQMLCEREPENLAHQRDLGIVLCRLSQILATLKRKKAAVNAAEKAEQIFKELTKRNAGFGDTKQNLRAATSLIAFAKKQGY